MYWSQEAPAGAAVRVLLIWGTQQPPGTAAASRAQPLGLSQLSPGDTVTARVAPAGAARGQHVPAAVSPQVRAPLLPTLCTALTAHSASGSPPSSGTRNNPAPARTEGERRGMEESQRGGWDCISGSGDWTTNPSMEMDQNR